MSSLLVHEADENHSYSKIDLQHKSSRSLNSVTKLGRRGFFQSGKSTLETMDSMAATLTYIKRRANQRVRLMVKLDIGIATESHA